MQKFLLSLMLVYLVACGSNSNKPSVNSTNGVTIGSQTYANTSQASNLIVAPIGTTLSFFEKVKFNITNTVYAVAGIVSAYAQTQNNAVFQITSTGSSTQISAADVRSGNFSATLTTGIIDSKDFLLIGYSNLSNSAGKSCALLGIRKSDDKIACIDVSPRCDSINNCRVTNYSSQVKVSSDGNTFFIVKGDGGLTKVNLAEPWSPVVTDIFTHAALGDASYPLVNANGDIFTCINLQSSSSNISCRIFDANGNTLINVTSSYPSCAFFDDHNHFYYLTSDPNGSYLNKMIFTAGNFSAANIDETQASSVSNNPLFITCKNVVQNLGRTFAIHLYNSSATNNTPRLIEFKSSSTPNSVTYPLNANSVYQVDLQTYTGGLVMLGLAADGSGVIERFDLTTNSVTTVLPTNSSPTKYTITSMSVNPSNGTLKFTGSTLAGNQAVIGTIDGATNAITLKNSTTTATAIVGLH